MSRSTLPPQHPTSRRRAPSAASATDREAAPGRVLGRASPRPDPFADVTLTTTERRARRLARDVHDRQVARHGGPMLEHVERVAAAVPASARTVALVHDVCERSGVWAGEIALLLDLDDDERDALVLLTKREREPLVRHVRRVVGEDPGPARELALLVLDADLADHAARAPGGPGGYARARAVLAGAGVPVPAG